MSVGRRSSRCRVWPRVATPAGRSAPAAGSPLDHVPETAVFAGHCIADNVPLQRLVSPRIAPWSAFVQVRGRFAAQIRALLRNVQGLGLRDAAQCLCRSGRCRPVVESGRGFWLLDFCWFSRRDWKARMDRVGGGGGVSSDMPSPRPVRHLQDPVGGAREVVDLTQTKGRWSISDPPLVFSAWQHHSGSRRARGHSSPLLRTASLARVPSGR